MVSSARSVWRRRPIPAGLPTTVLALGAALAALALLAEWLFGLASSFALFVLISFAAAAAGISGLAARHLGSQPFGVANRVTMIRVALAALVLGLVIAGPSGADRAAIAWLAIGLTTGELILDGVDGRLARRSGLATRFGARFDLETDAALILVLAALAWQLGKAGPWVLAAGLMRYGFVAAGRMWPRLRRPLAPSLRRQTVCVVQIVGLLMAISPLFPRPYSVVIAALTLATLTASFYVDVRALLSFDRVTGDRAAAKIDS